MKKSVSWFKRCLLLIPTLIFGALVFAQDLAVTGTVISSEDGLPIPGASVVQKGTTNGTITDLDGVYHLTVPQGAVVVFSFVGMKTQEITASDKTINVELSSESIGVNEVVVTALGIKREKKALGYAVQEVKGEDMAKAREVNVANSLSGKVSGVQVASSGTGTGGGSRITIRGNSSLSGNNEPLVVVDGVPITDFSSDTDDRWGNRNVDKGDGISDINPDDIESVSVLKGPAAAALYGSRAGNGVILITTKTGTQQKGLGISVNSNIVFETPLTTFDVQDEFGQGTGGEFVQFGGSSWGPKMTGQTVTDWTGEQRSLNAADNNIKDFLETGINFTNSLDLTVGSDKVNFRGSFSRMDYWGQLPNSKIERSTVNLRNMLHITEKLSLDLKVNYVQTEGENRPKLAADPDNVYSNYILMPRNIRYSDLEDYRNDDLTPRRWTDNGGNILNPYWTVNLNTNWDDRERFIMLAALNYEITDWMRLTLRHGFDNYTSRGWDQLGTGVPYWQSTGDVKQTTDVFKESNTDFLLMANKDNLFDSKFSGSLSVGGNMMRQKGQYIRQDANGLIVPDFYSINNGLDPRTESEFHEKSINSLYAMAQLSYNNYLYLDITGRNDWSSTLPSANSSYFYPSFGLSAVVSDMLELPTSISFFKLRASYAIVGNDTDPYRLSQNVNAGVVGQSGVPGATLPDELPLEDLKPEDIRSWEVGVDYRMYGNRLGLDLTWYKMNAFNQIIGLPQPAATGYRTRLINAGNVQNSGVELSLSGTPIQSGNFTWDIVLNWTKNVNKIIELDPEVSVYVLSGGGAQVQIVAEEGGSYGDITGSAFARDDNGNMLVDDDGLPYATQDSEKLGNFQPDWMAGLTNSLAYKNLSLSFLLDMRKGGDIYVGSARSGASSGTLAETTYNDRQPFVVEGVTSSGQKSTTEVNPETYWKRLGSIDERWVYDGTNIRLRELSLSYRLSKSVLENTPLQGVVFSFVGRNLALLKNDLPGIDPESSYSQSNAQGLELGSVPIPRTYGFNVKVEF